MDRDATGVSSGAGRRLRRLAKENGIVAAKVDQEKCTVCGACVQACPVEAIRLDGQCAVIDKDACIDCGACLGECPAQAISLDS